MSEEPVTELATDSMGIHEEAHTCPSQSLIGGIPAAPKWFGYLLVLAPVLLVILTIIMEQKEVWLAFFVPVFPFFNHTASSFFPILLLFAAGYAIFCNLDDWQPPLFLAILCSFVPIQIPAKLITLAGSCFEIHNYKLLYYRPDHLHTQSLGVGVAGNLLQLCIIMALVILAGIQVFKWRRHPFLGKILQVCEVFVTLIY